MSGFNCSSSDRLSKKVEVLLTDYGSTDKSGKICDEYHCKYPEYIKVFHNNNQGLLLTRRFGFIKASGQYIINCDSDDKLEPGMFMKLETAIKRYNPNTIIFNSYK